MKELIFYLNLALHGLGSAFGPSWGPGAGDGEEILIDLVLRDGQPVLKISMIIRDPCERHPSSISKGR